MTSDKTFEKKRVLVTDHEQKSLKLLAEKIEVLGFEVQTASTGNDALKKFEKFLPDVVIIDRDLQRINGIQLLMKLFFNYPGVKLVLATDDSTNYKNFQLKDSIVAIISKSSSLKQLSKIFVQTRILSNLPTGGI